MTGVRLCGLLDAVLILDEFVKLKDESLLAFILDLSGMSGSRLGNLKIFSIPNSN